MNKNSERTEYEFGDQAIQALTSLSADNLKEQQGMQVSMPNLSNPNHSMIPVDSDSDDEVDVDIQDQDHHVESQMMQHVSTNEDMVRNYSIEEDNIMANRNNESSMRRRSFTPLEKLKILDEIQLIGFNRTQRKYKIQGTQITKWRKKIEVLRYKAAKVSYSK